MSALVSGEGVAIDLRRAGLGSRTVAGAIDFAVELTSLLLAFTVTAGVRRRGLRRTGRARAGRDGADPGRLSDRVRVADPRTDAGQDGDSGFGSCAMTAARSDFGKRSCAGLAGFFSRSRASPVLAPRRNDHDRRTSKSSKRVGDMMAGTFVLSTSGPVGPTALAAVELVRATGAVRVGPGAGSDSRVDDQFALQLRQFMLRAAQMSPSAQASWASSSAPKCWL